MQTTPAAPEPLNYGFSTGIQEGGREGDADKGIEYTENDLLQFSLAGDM